MDWNGSTALIGVLVGLATGVTFGALAVWAIASLNRSGGTWKGPVAVVLSLFAVGSLATTVAPARQFVEAQSAESPREPTTANTSSSTTNTAPQPQTGPAVTVQQDSFAFPDSPCYGNHRWVVRAALALEFVGAIELSDEDRAEFLATALGEDPVLDLIRDVDVVARSAIADASDEDFLGVCVALTGLGLPGYDIPEYDLTGYLDVASAAARG